MRTLVHLVLALTLACSPLDQLEEEEDSAMPDSPREPKLPGIERPDLALTATLEAVWQGEASYKARTEHLRPDGTPKYTNRLVHATSPYLRQHAHNPVNFYPWGEEAFAVARATHRPILLSIGYATCHWCHVMERESFEDEEIAAFLNTHFVSIKVDREERPDVDDVYMAAVQMLTGRGGWPMTIIMTPDGRPFFGGTYFPPRDGVRGGRTGFLTILRTLSDAWKQAPDKVESEAAKISEAMARQAQPHAPSDVPSAEAIDRVVEQLVKHHDTTWGGFGGAPKFPTPSTPMLLLRTQAPDSSSPALTAALHTLDAMHAGGMYDHLGGGFARYSTDERWLVPHFEKMLYDNAQLADLYVEAYKLTGDARYQAIALDVLSYLQREMTHPLGGLYSATDADSLAPNGESEEGWFFTWTPNELDALLGPQRATIAATVWGVTAAGHLDGRSVLHLPQNTAESAAQLGMSVQELEQELPALRATMLAARAQRPPPLLDDKVITAWNALAITAFARAGRAFADEQLIHSAVRTAEFLLSELRGPDGRLLRSWRNGKAHNDAVLDDHAFLARAMLDLFEATGDGRWFDEAVRLTHEVDRRFADSERGGYYGTASDAEALLTRRKPHYDGALPSGNAVMAEVLLRLEVLTTDATYRAQAERLFAAFGRVLDQQGSGSTLMLSALARYHDTPREVIIVGTPAQAEPLLQTLSKHHDPHRVVLALANEQVAPLARRVPIVEGKVSSEGQATAYVCSRGVCQRPVTSVSALDGLLKGAR